jgi:serine/threonine protein kinase
LKKIKPDQSGNGIPSSALRETAALRELQHPNIVSLLDVVHENGRLVLVFEYLHNDLKRYLAAMDRVGRDVAIPLVKSYLQQLMAGVEFCHARRVLHRDLKPDNLLISHDGALKIADFGLSRAYDAPSRVYTHEVVTQWYRPPEILLGGHHYSTGVDVWSVGCIFVEMLTCCALFPGDSEIDQLYTIFRTLGTPEEAEWPGVTRLPNYTHNFPKWRRRMWNEAEAFTRTRSRNELGVLGADLLDKLLIYDPESRISASQALRHAYFDDLAGAREVALDAQAWFESVGACAIDSDVDIREEGGDAGSSC